MNGYWDNCEDRKGWLKGCVCIYIHICMCTYKYTPTHTWNMHTNTHTHMIRMITSQVKAHKHAHNQNTKKKYIKTLTMAIWGTETIDCRTLVLHLFKIHLKTSYQVFKFILHWHFYHSNHLVKIKWKRSLGNKFPSKTIWKESTTILWHYFQDSVFLLTKKKKVWEYFSAMRIFCFFSKPYSGRGITVGPVFRNIDGYKMWVSCVCHLLITSQFYAWRKAGTWWCTCAALLTSFSMATAS